MKRVIVIRGSEDGVLGVTGNIKDAVRIANRSGYECNYTKVCEEIRKNKKKFNIELFIVTVYLPDRVELTFESFYLNN